MIPLGVNDRWNHKFDMEILNKSSSNIREEKEEEERRKADQLPSPSSFLHETNHGLCCFLA